MIVMGQPAINRPCFGAILPAHKCEKSDKITDMAFLRAIFIRNSSISMNLKVQQLKLRVGTIGSGFIISESCQCMQENSTSNSFQSKILEKLN